MLTSKIDVSAKHVHLCQKDVDILFPNGLTKKKNLAISPEFVCNERVKIHGQKNVSFATILAPIREYSQLELSFSDTHNLGIFAPDRLSGDIGDVPLIKISSKYGETYVPVIIPLMHLHCRIDSFISCFEKVDIIVNNCQGEIKINNVIVRPTDGCNENIIHVNTDEGNAIRSKKCSLLIDSLRLANPIVMTDIFNKSLFKSTKYIQSTQNHYMNTLCDTFSQMSNILQ